MRPSNKNSKFKIQNSKFVIIIMGSPGSGKGTQAELLAEKLNFYYLETSKVIQANFSKAKKNDFLTMEGKKYFIRDEKKLMEAGKLLSSAVIAFWIKNKIRELIKEEKGIIMDGSPRTLYEGEKLIPFLKKLVGPKNIKVILLELSEKQTIWRNSRRKSCQLMRHQMLFTKETLGLTKCPFDGSKLIIRKDDNPKIIKTRLKEYKERTFPLLDYFKKQGLKVKKINGEQSVADVFKDILLYLK